MHIGTRFCLRFAVFLAINSAIDFYLIQKPLQHFFNFSIALVIAGIFTYLDYRDLKKEKERT